MRMTGRHLRTDLDFSEEEIWHVFQVAKDLKEERKRGKSFPLLSGQSLAMIFQKPSTRTHPSFKVAMEHLGGHAHYFGPDDLQLGRGETTADTARVFGRYYDAIMARVFAHNDIEVLAQYAGVPVINGLSDTYHPCQALTDIFTIWEKRENLKELTISFVGDGNNNVTNSLLLLCARMGLTFHIGCPASFKPKKNILDLALPEIHRTEADIRMFHAPIDAVRGADVVYTDTWVSMGTEDEAQERNRMFQPYQVNSELLAHAKPDVRVMHCMPAHRGHEITDEVMDGPHSIIFDQAENRLHVQKAILVLLMSKHYQDGR